MEQEKAIIIGTVKQEELKKKMVIFRAMVNQSEMTPRICPIDASAIHSAREPTK